MKYLEKKNGLLPIGIVAKSYGISENCIRRMEAADLLKPAYISRESGYRYYDSANVSRIGTILTLRSFGIFGELFSPLRQTVEKTADAESTDRQNAPPSKKRRDLSL